MKTFFGDDTYMKFSDSDPVPRISIFGGILVSDNEEIRLIESIKKVVGRYTHSDLPVKYNLRDPSVKDAFTEFEKEDDYRKILANSLQIRKEIVEAADSIDYKIIVSVIKAYSQDRDILKSKKAEMTQYALENLIFRLGNEAKGNRDRYQIVFDWPNGSDPKPFYRPYYYLYNRDKTIGQTENYCGPLKKLEFSSSILFTKATHNSCLQFADIVIGALRDKIEMCIEARDDCTGKQIVDRFRDKIRRSPKGKRVGYGVVVASGNQELKRLLEKHFDR